MDIKGNDTLTQSEILELGWTKSMIGKYLPDPTLKPNPRYKKAAPMKLWNRQDVLDAMDSEVFKAAMEKASKRKAAAEKACATKAKKTVEEMTAVGNGLKIKIIPDENLRHRTLQAKQNWEREHGNFAYIPFDITPETMERWIVNYIRHNLVKYDTALERLYGKCGRYEAYPEFKRIVLEKIAAAYPKYTEECKRQIGQII